MCDVDGASDVWKPVWVRARTQHRCSECGATIPAKETYMRVGSLCEGQWETLYVHEVCWKLWEFVHAVLCGGRGHITIGGLWEEIVNFESPDFGFWEDGDYDAEEAVREGLKGLYHEITTHYQALEA